ncbi:hypothetical protein P3342_002599 [Pyrenophora teres f. teres]|nr:hypothetical protein P3342_002599 [Pyrenophora teres f. teres]
MDGLYLHIVIESHGINRLEQSSQSTTTPKLWLTAYRKVHTQSNSANDCQDGNLSKCGEISRTQLTLRRLIVSGPVHRNTKTMYIKHQTSRRGKAIWALDA